jgi:hypothetical protein
MNTNEVHLTYRQMTSARSATDAAIRQKLRNEARYAIESMSRQSLDMAVLRAQVQDAQRRINEHC